MAQPRHEISSFETGRALLESLAAQGAGSVSLQSPKGAAGHLGPLFWKSLIEELRKTFPGMEIEAWLDCADDAGYALAALREGCDRLLFRGDPEVARKLTDIARREGAEVQFARPAARR